MTDHSKVMGFGTTRVVGKSLNKNSLSAKQLKGMSTLQNICGVKKVTEKETDNSILKKLTQFGEATKKNKILDHFESDINAIDDNKSNSTTYNSNDNNPNRSENINPLNVANQFKRFKSCDVIEPKYNQVIDVTMQCEDYKTNMDDIKNNNVSNEVQNVLGERTTINPFQSQEKSHTTNAPINITNNNLIRNPKKISLKNLL